MSHRPNYYQVRQPDENRSSSAGNRLDSHELFRGWQEVLIQHAGALYRLRITRQNKLILTK